SISSPIPGMPDGKPAGVRCIHLNAEFLCAIFGRPERPAVCGGFKAEEQLCADDRESAIRMLGWLEQATA
ncbi:YkgJ family cysteine cluster protein, partial [Pseudomonas sp. OA3]|nr:YkgJ family cysteine cluster protein [Pseudomonas sp. OA3]